MGLRNLDPFNSLARTIRASSLATEDDRKAAIKMAFQLRKSGAFTIDKAAIACRGVFSMLEALAVEAELRCVEQGSSKHKTLTWCYAKHVEVMSKCFAIIGKGQMPHISKRHGAQKQERSAMWHPQGTARTHAVKEPEIAES